MVGDDSVRKRCITRPQEGRGCKADVITEEQRRSYIIFLRDTIRRLWKGFHKNLVGETKHIGGLIEKSSRFHWTDKCQQEFEGLKEEFQGNSMMHHFNLKLDTFLEVDASQSGICAMLIQDSGESGNSCSSQQSYNSGGSKIPPIRFRSSSSGLWSETLQILFCRRATGNIFHR